MKLQNFLNFTIDQVSDFRTIFDDNLEDCIAIRRIIEKRFMEL